MGRKKKSFIDKKNSSTYHLLFRSQRDVAGDDDDDGDDGSGSNPNTTTTSSEHMLWPSPNNNPETDQKVLLASKNKQPPKEASFADNHHQDPFLDVKAHLSKAGLVDDFDYEKHMKPITGTGTMLESSGTNQATRAMLHARSTSTAVKADDLVREVDRQLESITLTADCMDDEIAAALFGDDFDENDYEALNDDFVFDASQVVVDDNGYDEGGGANKGFDFAAHIQGLIAKATFERSGANNALLSTIHEQGRQDHEFFAKAKPLGEDDDDDSGHFGDDWQIDGTPGVVPKLSEPEEKALCDKFEQTLLEYDSDDIGEGQDDEGAMGDRPLEGDAQLEAAMDDFIFDKQDEIFMAGTLQDPEYLAKKQGGGSGFSALVGTRMIPVKELDDQAPVTEGIRPIEDVLGEATHVLATGKAAPPPEEVLIDGKSYFSEKMRNPWDCESILTTYSNLDNNPVSIDGTTTRRRRRQRDKKQKPTIEEEEQEQYQQQQILLSDKTGLPLGVLPSKHGQNGEDYDDDDDFANNNTFVSVNKGVARKKEESAEEKKARKVQAKKERQLARMQKKLMKEVFQDEFAKRTQDVLVNDVGGKSVFRF